MSGKGPRLTDQFKELKRQVQYLKDLRAQHTGTLQEKKERRDECYERLKTLGVKKPENPKSRRELILAKKKDLLKRIKTKRKAVEDAVARLEEIGVTE